MCECIDDHTCKNHFRIYLNTHNKKPLVADGKRSEIILVFKKSVLLKKFPETVTAAPS